MVLAKIMQINDSRESHRRLMILYEIDYHYGEKFGEKNTRFFTVFSIWNQKPYCFHKQI
jgi:hypothetical protein